MIAVLVTHHYNENQKYLDLCLDSVMRSEIKEPIFPIVIADTPERPKFDEGEDVRGVRIWDRELVTISQKINAWQRFAPAEADVLVILNDDVIVSKYAIQKLADMARMGVIVNPMSNNDFGSAYASTIGFDDKPMMPVMDYDASYLDQVSEFRTGNNLYLFRDWVPFFCTAMTRHTWNTVGECDEKLAYRHDDEDYCMRARLNGIQSLIDTSVFSFHFGSKSLGRIPKETLDACTEHFRKKWANGFSKGPCA